MSDYLNHNFDWSDPTLVSVFDETPFWSARFGALLLEHVPLQPGMRLLDLACGTGFPLIELGQCLGQGCLSVGIDPWIQALERARLKLKTAQVDYIHLVAGDGTQMPFAGRSFDLVTMNLGINNFEHPAAILDECHRVLVSSGHLALTTNPFGHMQEFYAEFHRLLLELGLLVEAKKLESEAEHRIDLDQIQRILQAAGFELNKTWQAEFYLRYLNGSAFFRHRFIQQAFLDGWCSVLEPGHEQNVFERLEQRLNERAKREGELVFTVPVLYLEAGKSV
jgi:ubiquinone/menaquinone biosynthesis C-methylase UbiE